MYNHSTKHTKATNQNDITDKKVYHTPKLSKFGHVHELTKTNNPFGGSFDDGGSGGAQYTS